MDVVRDKPVTAETVTGARWVARRFYAPGMDVDDLTQEALIGAWEARQDYQPDRGASFKSFEFTCMSRKVMDAVTTARRVKRGAGTPPSELDPDDAAPGSLAEHVEDRAELRRVLDRLPTLTAIEARAVVGLAVGVPAAELGEVKRIDNAAQRGRRKLREAA